MAENRDGGGNQWRCHITVGNSDKDPARLSGVEPEVTEAGEADNEVGGPDPELGDRRDRVSGVLRMIVNDRDIVVVVSGRITGGSYR